jgi:hypothetical protein
MDLDAAGEPEGVPSPVPAAEAREPDAAAPPVPVESAAHLGHDLRDPHGGQPRHLTLQICFLGGG